MEVVFCRKADASVTVTGTMLVAGMKIVDPAAVTELAYCPGTVPDNTLNLNVALLKGGTLAAGLNVQMIAPVAPNVGRVVGVKVPPDESAT